MKPTETKPIICGTDFSEGASQAALVADALARRLDAPLILVCSADERGDFPDHLRERLMNDDRPRMTHEAERLRALIPAEAEKRGVVTEVRIVESGNAGKTICEAAERFCADLVCIGSHGHSGLAAAVVGSVAQAVIAHSRSPVLLIRP